MMKISKHARHIFWIIFCFIWLGILTACGGGSTTTPPPPPPPPTPVSIASQPVAQTVALGDPAVFSVRATGDGLAYQWQYSADNGASWYSIAGATGPTYRIATVDASLNATQYRVSVFGTAGSINSQAVTLTVISAPTITTQPSAQSVPIGSRVSFSVVATGQALSYRWQSSTDASTWTAVEGGTAASLTLEKTTKSDNGRYFRVLVSNGGGSIYSNAILLTVPPDIRFPSGTLQLRGVNLAVAEFGNVADMPGVYGYNYIYPPASDASYFRSKGMNFIRMPFRWERLQPVINQPLNAEDLVRFQESVNSMTSLGMTVMLDQHNSARYKDKIVGSAELPYSAFADFWARLATVYKNNPLVIFELTNEPYDMPTETWVTAANAAIAAIRATGATNTIAVSGNGYSGAAYWSSPIYGTPNSVALLDINDSGNNIVFDVHNYFIADNAASDAPCSSTTIGVEQMMEVTQWLKGHGKRALLGEFATVNSSSCRQAIARMLDYMQSNADVWVGWSWWAAGPWWGAYPFSIEPINGQDVPLISVLEPYLR